jgi:hypothetical protein
VLYAVVGSLLLLVSCGGGRAKLRAVSHAAAASTEYETEQILGDTLVYELEHGGSSQSAEETVAQTRLLRASAAKARCCSSRARLLTGARKGLAKSVPGVTFSAGSTQLLDRLSEPRRCRSG